MKKKEKDLMLFGKTKEVLAHEVNTGKLSIDDLMNEWSKRYALDILDSLE